MPRLRNERTRVVVNVDDETAEMLRSGSDKWAEVKSESTKTPAKKAASSKSSSK